MVVVAVVPYIINLNLKTFCEYTSIYSLIVWNPPPLSSRHGKIVAYQQFPGVMLGDWFEQCS